MKATKATSSAAALVLAAAIAMPALAQETAATPVYVGATFGQAKWRPGCPQTGSCDDLDRALRILAGYQINRTLAAEIGFHNLGKATQPGTSIKANAWEAVLLAAFPVAGPLSLYGKLGGYRGNAEGSGALIPGKETNYGITWGLGAQLNASANLGLRLEWQNYPALAGGTVSPRSDVNVYSAGAIWRFR